MRNPSTTLNILEIYGKNKIDDLYDSQFGFSRDNEVNLLLLENKHYHV